MSFAERISTLGERPFMVCDGRTFSYAELGREIEKLGERLREKSVEPGQAVAVTGEYNFLAAAWFLALAANRNVVVPLVGGNPREVGERIEEAGAQWVVEARGARDEGRGARDGGRGEKTEAGGENVQPRCARDRRLTPARTGQALKGQENRTHDSLPTPFPRPSPLVPLFRRLREAGRAGLILFSSGSTGKAKGMLHDLDTLMGSYGARKAKGLRILAFMGLDHIGGIDVFFRGIASGACLIVPRERSPEAICRLIEEQRVNVLPATPSFLNLMLMSDAWRERDLTSLEIIGFGAERMPAEVLWRLKEVFPNARLQQKFGTSETNAIRTVSKESDPLWMRIEDPVVEWKIVEEELWLKTPSRILGYLNHDGGDRLAADGWYRTGDLVEEDGEGFFRIVGRRESVINVGGEKVVPGEVEAAILEAPGVRDCRVFGEANSILGEVVAAEVVADGEVEEKELARGIRRFCREKLAPYKVPVKIRVVKEIEVSDRFKRKI